MALPDPTQQDAPAPAFTWGAGGARMTPEDIAARRKVADALALQGSDSSAFPTGTRGAGLWTQGLARMAKGLEAGLINRRADDAAQQNAADSRATTAAMIAALLGGGAAAPAAATTTATPTVAAVPDSSAPRGIRNNNALNIEDGDFARSQPGYVGTDGRFAKFETPDQGTAAANALLDTYQQKHGLNTIAGIVGRWAPTSDGNNVSAYAADVAHQMGIDPNAPLTAAQRPALIAAMGRHENGVPIPMPGAPAPVQVASNGPLPVAGAPAAATIAPTKPVVASDDDEEDTPAATPAVAKVTAAMPAPVAAAPVAPAAPSPAVAKVTAAMPPAAAAPAAVATPGTARVQAALQAFTSPYVDAQTKQVAGMVLQKAMQPQASAPFEDPNLGIVQKGPDGTYHVLRPPRAGAPYKDEDGNLLQKGPDGTLHAVIQADRPTGAQKDFEYGQSHPGFIDYQKQMKAPTVSIDQKSEGAQATEVGKAKGKVQAEDIEAGGKAYTKLRQLATLDEANKSGGDDISSGPFGKAILSGKQGLSELTGVDLNGVPESEVIQKVGYGLATNMVKAISNRPSQMEFGKALENVPGLLMSKQGRVAMTSILTQEARAEQDIGHLANKFKEVTDGPSWQEVKDKYYEDHPLISPFTGKPFGATDIQMLTKSGETATGAPATTAPAGVDPAALAEAKRRGLIP